MHLVGGVAVPHNQLAVLAGGDQVPGVSPPVHRIHLTQISHINNLEKSTDNVALEEGKN